MSEHPFISREEARATARRVAEVRRKAQAEVQHRICKAMQAEIDLDGSATVSSPVQALVYFLDQHANRARPAHLANVSGRAAVNFRACPPSAPMAQI